MFGLRASAGAAIILSPLAGIACRARGGRLPQEAGTLGDVESITGMRKLSDLSVRREATRDAREAVARMLQEALRAAPDPVGRGAGDNAGT